MSNYTLKRNSPEFVKCVTVQLAKPSLMKNGSRHASVRPDPGRAEEEKCKKLTITVSIIQDRAFAEERSPTGWALLGICTRKRKHGWSLTRQCIPTGISKAKHLLYLDSWQPETGLHWSRYDGKRCGQCRAGGEKAKRRSPDRQLEHQPHSYPSAPAVERFNRVTRFENTCHDSDASWAIVTHRSRRRWHLTIFYGWLLFCKSIRLQTSVDN